MRALALGGSLVILSWPDAEPESEEERPERFEDATLLLADKEQGSPIFPPGEWWGKAHGFVVLVQMGAQGGSAAVATGEEDILLAVEVVVPEGIELQGDRVELQLSNAEHISTWIGRLAKWWKPGDPPPCEVGSEDDVIDQINIEQIYGALSAQHGKPFALMTSDRHDPRTSVGASVLDRLRGLLRKRGEESD